MSRNFVGVESSIDFFLWMLCSIVYILSASIANFIGAHLAHLPNYSDKECFFGQMSSCLNLDISYLVRLSYQGSTVISLIRRYGTFLLMPRHRIWQSVKNYNFLTKIDRN